MATPLDPTIRDGDLILVDRSVDKVVDNGIYVVTFGGLVLVKRIQSRRDGGVILISDEPSVRKERRFRPPRYGPQSRRAGTMVRKDNLRRMAVAGLAAAVMSVPPAAASSERKLAPWQEATVAGLKGHRWVRDAYWAQDISLWLAAEPASLSWERRFDMVCNIADAAGRPVKATLIVTIWDARSLNSRSSSGGLKQIFKDVCSDPAE